MGKPKAPTPPSPQVTAAAQTGTNVATAQANAFLGNVNQYGPNGSLTYASDPNDTYTFTDPNSGQEYELQRETQTTTLSPEQQAIADQNNSASLNLATLGNNLSDTLGDKLNGNFTLDNESTEARLFELGSERLDPRFEQAREKLDQSLANQGIGIGTEAYDRAVGLLGQQENDAYNQLALTGRAQAAQEQFAEDNQRINQIGALMSGGQVSQPQFGQTNQPQLPTVDYAGLVNQNFNQQMGIYNQELQQSQGLWGGVLGLGGSLLSLSDERAKKDKKRVGSVDGMGLYEYRYKGSSKESPKQLGLMAQEVKKTRPEAVSNRPDGLMQVDYAKALAPKKKLYSGSLGRLK